MIHAYIAAIITGTLFSNLALGASSMTNHIGNIHNGTCALVASIVHREEILLPAAATIMCGPSLVVG